MRDSVSRSPQLTTPLIPHISLALFPSHSQRLQFVNLRFNVEELYSLQTTIDQARNTIQKSKAQDVFVQEKQNGGARNRKKHLSQPAPALGLRSEERGREISCVRFAFEPQAGIPVRILVVFENVVGKRLDIMVKQRVMELGHPGFRL